MRPEQQLEIIHNIMVQYFGEEFIIRGRKEPATERRHIFSYIAYQNTPSSLKDIAEFLKKREHSTIHHEIKTCRDRMETYKDFAKTVEEIEKRVKDAIETDNALGILGK